MVQRAADQPVRSQFAPQGCKLVALAIPQKRLRDTERAAKTGNDSADGRNFDLRLRVTHQIDFAVPDLPVYRPPAAIDGDTRALPFERLQMLFFEEAFEAALRVAAVLANHADGAAFRRFGDQPVKVGRVIRHEPDASRIRRAIFRQPHDGLNEGHGFDRRPPRGTRNAARGAIRAHDAVHVQLFALGAGFDFQPQATRVWTDAQETRVKSLRRARLLGFAF